ncbi:hypothetical protein [Poseidonibacter sp.]|uniref:hypothetical protein n=1 Tax=Poseidonibacter sp. TaxID=2321188 RepID=UPI003C784591
MTFLNNIKDFFNLAKELKFDLVQIYAQDPNGTYAFLSVLLVIVLIIVFLIRKSIKTSLAIKLVSNIQNSSTFDEYNNKLEKLSKELPKRGLKLADTLNSQKEEILAKELILLNDFDIKEKIVKYKQISEHYALMAKNSKKYKNEELSSFYEKKSKSLLDDNLDLEIKKYYKKLTFDEKDVEYVNSIVSYANTRTNPNEILDELTNTINRYSYAFNLDLFKFVKALDKKQSGAVYFNCTQKLEEVIQSKENLISTVILSYMLENGEKEKVYSYISNLENKIYLQSLYNNYFSKVDDQELDFSFIANETKIDSDYKNYIDTKLTNNWSDTEFMNYVLEAPRVIEVIGHSDYRSILERIENLQKEEERDARVTEALDTANKAYKLATEAKELAELNYRD